MGNIGSPSPQKAILSTQQTKTMANHITELKKKCFRYMFLSTHSILMEAYLVLQIENKVPVNMFIHFLHFLLRSESLSFFKNSVECIDLFAISIPSRFAFDKCALSRPNNSMPSPSLVYQREPFPQDHKYIQAIRLIFLYIHWIIIFVRINVKIMEFTSFLSVPLHSLYN